jgi:hypothetical protein
MRRFILFVSALGAALFGGALLLSFVEPLLIERAAREIVRIEVERRVGEKIDDLSDKRIAGLAQRALQKTDVDIQRTQESIRADLPAKVARVVADMLKVDCECRKRMVEDARRGEFERLTSLGQVREKLVGLIESTYASVAANLMREFRIFTGANAVAFALLGIVTFFRRAAALQLALPAIVLVGAVCVTGSFYLFNQNWLHTIVFGEYVGFAYVAYLGAVSSLLADVVFNRARVTTQILNAAFEAVGSAGTVVPC